ncbi:hypothetical protein ABLN72_06230 [Mycobacterium tuberculosis]
MNAGALDLQQAPQTPLTHPSRFRDVRHLDAHPVGPQDSWQRWLRLASKVNFRSATRSGVSSSAMRG